MGADLNCNLYREENYMKLKEFFTKPVYGNLTSFGAVCVILSFALSIATCVKMETYKGAYYESRR